MLKSKLSGDFAAKEKARMAERISQLGIPPEEMTESVTLAASALLEKLDDIGRELERAKTNFTELEQLVDIDVVAPVPNRRAFMRRLNWAISMHERYGHPCSVLFFDLNDFKQVNDTHGHAAGDDVIRHISKILQESLRDSDFMARMGGDEFAIILYYAKLSDARERGNKIAARLARTPAVSGAEQFLVSAACGAYELKKGDSPEAALAGADAAMYQDKKSRKKQSADASA